MITKYLRPVEEAPRYTFSTLNERQRRLFAASEAPKLGHGGIAYIAQLKEGYPDEYPETMKIRFDEELPLWNYRAIPDKCDN